MADKRYLDNDGFLSRLLSLFSPVEAVRSVGQAADTFSDIVNNRGVTDDQVEQAGMTAGAFGSLAPRPRFPGQNAWPKVSLEAFGGRMSPETKAYLRGVMESNNRPSGDPQFYLHDPATSRAFREGMDPSLMRRPQSEPRQDAGVRQPDPVQEVKSPESPVESAPAKAKFLTPQKNDVLRRMANGTAPEKFKTPAERRYAKDILRQSEALGVPVSKMWEAIATNARKRAWAVPAAGAAASMDDPLSGIEWGSVDFQKLLDSGELY